MESVCRQGGRDSYGASEVTRCDASSKSFEGKNVKLLVDDQQSVGQEASDRSFLLQIPSPQAGSMIGAGVVTASDDVGVCG